MKTTEQMNNELQEKFPFLEIISEYTGANNKVHIRCNDCGYEWEAIPRSRYHIIEKQLLKIYIMIEISELTFLLK